MTGDATRIIFHPLYARRGFTALRRTWNRYDLALQTLGQSSLRDVIPILPAPPATENDLLTVHDPAYIDLIQHLDITGQGKLDGSTPAWTGMYARAERIVGGSLLAADLVIEGRADHVFNPAGGQHHAHAGRGGGFCVFNDVVAAVRRLQRRGLHRIAVVDLDGHHGDGTASLLCDEPVLVISLHQYGDRTYPGTGAASEIGAGSGLGYTVNLPLRRGTGDTAYLDIIASTVEPILKRFAPEIMIVQFGTDAHAADPLLRLRLSTAAFAWMSQWMLRIAQDLCGGRLIVVGGGGYDPIHVVRCWILMLGALCGHELDTVHPDAASWLAEPVQDSDPDADAESLICAARARKLVMAAHGLPD
jgi:acetoin utilization protein AcuC